jgi:hypothetical protein
VLPVYVVVETDPQTGRLHVLFPHESVAQVHETLEAARVHRNWFIESEYMNDPSAGEERVRIYRLEPID